MRILSQVLFAFACIISSPVFAGGNDFWEAIEAWEHADDKKAAILFKPFVNGHPVARPYCKDLSDRGILKDDSHHENFKGTPQYQVACQWFEASRLQRRIISQQKKIDREKRAKPKKKLLTEQTKNNEDLKTTKTPPAQYLFAALCTGQNDKLTSYKRSLKFSQECLDPRAILAHERCRDDFVMSGTKVNVLAADLKRHLEETESLGEALYRMRKQDNEALSTLFLRTAAYFGHPEAQYQLTLTGRMKSYEEAFYWYSQGAEQKHLECCSQLVHMYDKGKGVKRNAEKALFFSKLACELNKENNWVIYQNHAALLAYVDPEEAIKYYELAIKYGADTQSQLDFAVFLLKQNEIEYAQKIYFDTSLLGHVESMNIYINHFATPEGCEEIFPICLKAARTDHQAMSILSLCFVEMSQHGQDKYKIDLYHLLKEYAEREDDPYRAQALYELGFLIERNNDDGEFEGDPLSLYKEAAMLGDARALHYLGNCYEKGLCGAEVNPPLALKYFEEAIAGGVTAGLNNAGTLLMEQDAPESDKRAVSYFTQAYKQNDYNKPFAAFNLAKMHSDGRGGTIKHPKIIRAYLQVAKTNPQLIVDANYELAILDLSEGSSLKDLIPLLKQGVQEKHVNSLLLTGQILLYHPDFSDDIKVRKKGVKYIFEAAKARDPGAFALFTFLKLTGVPGVLKKDSQSAKLYMSHFTPEEVGCYGNLVMRYKEKETDQLDGSDDEDGEIDSESLEDSGFVHDDELNDHSVESDEIYDETSMELISDLKSEELDKEIDPIIAKLQQEVDEIFGKKQIKWRKVQNLLKRVIKLTSGKLSQGKGSGFRIRAGDERSGLHIPHGGDKMVRGGRIESLKNFIGKALDNYKNSSSKDETHFSE